MNHLKGYATAEAAATSKAGLKPGAVIDTACPCKQVHVVKPKTSRVLAVAEAPLRARPGAMTAAVTLVLAGEATVAQSARDFGVDPGRLEAKAAAAFRLACLERDHYTCLECGAMATEVQHRVARGMGGTADPRIAFGLANGASLCSPSHRLAETRDPGMYDRGFWRWQGEDPATVPVHAETEYGRELRWLLPDGGVSLTSPYEAAA